MTAHEGERDAQSALAFALTRRFLRAVDAADPIAEALAVTREVLGAARANYYARDPVGRTLVMTHATESAVLAVEEARVYPEGGDSLGAQCLREGRPITSTAYRSSPPIAAAMRAHHQPEAHSLTSLPVRVGNELRGVVQAVNVAPSMLAGDDAPLTEVTALLSTVWGSAERRQELATLGETVLRVNRSLDLAATFDAVLDGMIALVPSLTASVYLDDIEPDALVRVALRDVGSSTDMERYPTTRPRPIDGSLVGWVYRHRQSVRVPDLHDDPRVLRSGPDALPSTMEIRSYIMVPMLVAGEPVGALTCSRRGVGAFSSRDLRIVEGFAPLAAQAVANARLYAEATQARANSDRILEDLADAIITLDRKGTVVRWNAGAQRLLGFVPEEIVGQHPPVVPFDADVRYAGTYRRVLAGESFVGMENRHRHRDGHWLDVLISISPCREGGRIVGTLAVIRDITPLKQLEARLKAEIADGTRRARDQEYIAAVAQACNSAADGPAILQALADRTAEWSNSSTVVSFAQGKAEIAAFATMTPEEDAPLAPYIVAFTELLMRDASDNGTHRFVPVVHDMYISVREYPLVQAALDCGYHTCAFVPIRADGTLVGTLNAAARDDIPPLNAQSLDTLRLVAEQAGLAITKDRLLRQVEAQVRALEEASRHKDDFLASLSHELRTPLNAILGFGAMIADGHLRDADEIHEAANDIVGSGRLLLGQVNDLLDMARASAGQMTVLPEAIALAPLIVACQRVLTPLVLAKRQTLRADVPPDLPLVRGDSVRLRQVILNLLTNAHKFTPAGGAITVRVWSHDDRVGIAVRDTGIGIAPENLTLVFEPFRRVETGYARKQAGTGLGLALSRRLMEIMGGTLTAESTPHSGSTFTVMLPVERREARDEGRM